MKTVKVHVMPMCQTHLNPAGDTPALYDAATIHGPHAYMCQACFDRWGRQPAVRLELSPPKVEQALPFHQWMGRVDKALCATVGVFSRDISDWSDRDAYDSGMTPQEAAAEALADDDTFGFGAQEWL
jgi:hypothetical protein